MPHVSPAPLFRHGSAITCQVEVKPLPRKSPGLRSPSTLVALAKHGVQHEITLAAEGLEYLMSLAAQAQSSGPQQGDAIAPQSPIEGSEARAFQLGRERLDARFLVQWRIPWAI